MTSMQDKIVLVTGSNKGIGYSIAKGMIALGARVILHSEDLEAVKNAYHTLGAKDFVVADFCDPVAVENMIEKLSSLEKLDVLINNAGFEAIMPFKSFDAKNFEKILQINLHAPIRITAGLLPLLQKSRSASIINITSIHQEVPVANNGPYAVAKAGMHMFTKNLALELANDQIRVNALAPGAIETDMNRDVIDEMGRENWNQWIPLGRVGSTQDMIDPVIFLASDASQYITGSTLYADGGYRHNLLRYTL